MSKKPGMMYRDTGVDYDAMDPHKRDSLKAAEETHAVR